MPLCKDDRGGISYNCIRLSQLESDDGSRTKPGRVSRRPHDIERAISEGWAWPLFRGLMGLG